MADPISSSVPNATSSTCFDEVDEQNLIPLPSPSAVGPAVVESEGRSPAVQTLVDRFSPPTPMSFVQGSAERAVPARSFPVENNAYRTTMRPDDLSPYADSGRTSDGEGAFAAAALLKTHVTSGVFEGSDLELLSASAQIGRQTEAQVGLVRASITSGLYIADGTVSGEALTARANYGILNDDGSVGMNFGAAAVAAGFEATAARSGWSVTTGLSAQLGGSVSGGLRDADGDGNTEFCLKASTPLTTFGLCVETPF